MEITKKKKKTRSILPPHSILRVNLLVNYGGSILQVYLTEDITSNLSFRDPCTPKNLMLKLSKTRGILLLWYFSRAELFILLGHHYCISQIIWPI